MNDSKFERLDPGPPAEPEDGVATLASPSPDTSSVVEVPVPATFLQVAAVEEALQLILYHLPSTALVNLAATCRLLFPPSIAVLWEFGSDDSLQQLLSVLPDEALLHYDKTNGRRRGAKYGFYKKADLERVHLYGSFIRELEITEPVAPHILENLQTLSIFLPGRHILPNLRRILLTYSTSNALLIQLMLSPSVLHIDLQLPDDDSIIIPKEPVYSVLEWLPDRSAGLQSLAISWTLEWTDEVIPIATALRRLTQLRDVSALGIGFASSILAALLDLPELQELSLSGYKDGLGDDVLFQVRDALFGRSFKSLNFLDCTSNLAVCAVIVQHCPQLEHLFISSAWNTQLAKSWTNSLTLHGKVSRLSICFTNVVSPTLWTSLQLLAKLPIHDFSVWVDEWEPPKPKFDSFHLFTQWPDLHRLDLHVGDCDGPTLSGLLHILRHCLSLQYIALDHLSSNPAPVKERPFAPSGLEELAILKTDVSVHSLVRFLSVACPEVVVTGFQEAEAVNERLEMIRYATSVAAGTADFTY